jgi:hypothetical protein
MPIMFDAETRAQFQQRIASLTPQANRRWGRLSPNEMVCHLSDQLRMALGDIKTTPTPGPLWFPPLKWLVIGPMPWPHGAKGARESFTTRPATWDRDVATLRELLDRFGARGDQENWPDHPRFGPMTRDHWGRLTCKHFNHHLRQFSA